MLSRSLPYPHHHEHFSWFNTLAHLPYAIFLDSGASSRGRYDIFSAWPDTVITTVAGNTSVHIGKTVTSDTRDPFLILKELLQQRATTSVSDLPFCGGAMGYFAYDLGRRFEIIPTIAKDDLNIPDMVVGLYDWAVIVDHAEKTASLVKYGASDTPSWEALQILIQDAMRSFTHDQEDDFKLTSAWQSNMTQADYAHAFNKVMAYIHAGDCYQINLAQRFSASCTGDPWQAYQRLTQANCAPFSSFMRLPQAAILSLSPERFVEVRDNAATTKPIKGTRPRGKTQADDDLLANALRESSKDRAENVMIVDLLRNDFGKTCMIGSVKVPELFALESYPAVHHLVSTVTGKLGSSTHALDLLRGCFPGGSITGAPKIRAMQIIEELEPHRRNVYCGSIGYISYHGDMDTNIAIRTLVWQNDALYCWAGGGLVADSVMEDEYQETFDKLQRILPVLST